MSAQQWLGAVGAHTLFTTPRSLVGVLVASLVCSVVIIVISVHSARGRSAKGVVRHLEKAGYHDVKTDWRLGLWNPAKPLGVDNPLYGRGVGHYTLGDDGAVHLRFQPKDGVAREYSGPIPPALAGLSSGPRIRGRRFLRRVIIAYVAIILGAFVGGAAAASGSWAARVLIGVACSFGALLAVAVVVRIVEVAWAVRSLAKRKSASATGSDDLSPLGEHANDSDWRERLRRVEHNEAIARRALEEDGDGFG